MSAPGAMYRARWMAKALYSMKVLMYKGQFHLTPAEEKKCQFFLSLLYTEAWISSHNSLAAPANDLSFLKAIVKYKAINNGISDVAARALSRHLWYINEELVALSFFHCKTDNETKRRMISQLQQASPVEPFRAVSAEKLI